MTFLCKRHEQVECDDLLMRDCENPRNAPLIEAGIYVPPQRVHVERSIDFARAVGTEDLIVHCAQGLSRSPAVAWCILFDQLGSVAAATERLFQLRPQAVPNDLIIRWGVEILTGKLDLLSEVLRLLRSGREGLSRSGWE